MKLKCYNLTIRWKSYRLLFFIFLKSGLFYGWSFWLTLSLDYRWFLFCRTIKAFFTISVFMADMIFEYCYMRKVVIDIFILSHYINSLLGTYFLNSGKYAGGRTFCGNNKFLMKCDKYKVNHHIIGRTWGRQMRI